MITNTSGSTTVKQRNFQFLQKEKRFPSLLVGNNDFFSKVCSLKSTFRFPAFMISLLKKSKLASKV